MEIGDELYDGSVVDGSAVNAIVDGTLGDTAVVIDGKVVDCDIEEQGSGEEENDRVIESFGDGTVVSMMMKFVVGATVIDIGLDSGDD